MSEHGHTRCDADQEMAAPAVGRRRGIIGGPGQPKPRGKKYEPRFVSLPTDIRVTGAAVFLLPVTTRVPLKFGAQVVESVTCARVVVEVRTRDGRRGVGWGETPLAVQWGWPAALPYQARHDAMIRAAVASAAAFCSLADAGHPLEVGVAFRRDRLDAIATASGDSVTGAVPELAALIAASAVDLAVHDAYGVALGLDTYATYGAEHLASDLVELFGPELTVADRPRFVGRRPADFLVADAPRSLLAWHLVGGLDPLEPEDLTGAEPDDGHPVLLADWICTDGLECLKVKLRGDDLDWDIERLLRVGRIGLAHGVTRFCADFNCTVTDPAYVDAALDAIGATAPELAARLLYVEQPFPYDLETHAIDVTSLAARTRLFLDESAHDWRHVARGRALGWNGVALKTCKTQSGALLSLAWARAQGMDLMVQDLTNPMLAALPHLRLAAHADTLAGVETNAMQFYPAASAAEAAVHPGVYARRHGRIDLGTLGGPGFGMRVAEIARPLPEPHAVCGSIAADAWRHHGAGGHDGSGVACPADA
jgi:L-alanine-DL-glutamate epimerase-like enolase superfamily enzyme